PVSTDAGNAMSLEENTVFETVWNGNILTILTKVKTEWLLDAGRQFPVMVDPTTHVYPNTATNWSRSVHSDGRTQTTGFFGVLSNVYLRYHIKFNTSSITDSDIVVNSVTGYVNFLSGTGTSPTTRQWQFANSADPTTTSGTTLYNSANLGL